MSEELKIRAFKTSPNLCDAVGDDGHPTFDNPHGWTEEQVTSFFDEAFKHKRMAFNIKWMGLAHYMKNETYEEALASVRKQAS